MYRVRKIHFLVVLFCIINFTLTGCTNSQNNTKVKIKVACFPNLTHSQALLGMAEGQFQKAIGEKNEIEWKTFNAGPSEIEALLAGEVDIGYVGPVPAINGCVKSKGELQIIAGATDAGAILVSRKELGKINAKDLDGKKVAVPQYGNTQDLILRYILSKNRLKDSTKRGTVQIIQAENPDIKTLLDKGDIDAALVPEPWGSRLVKEINANIILDYDQVYNQGNYSSAVLVARTDFIKQNPEVVEKFIRTHVELTQYINENKGAAKKVLNNQIYKLTKNFLPTDILDISFNRLIITYNPEKESISEFIKISKEMNLISQEPDFVNLFNINILNKVLKEKGLNVAK